MQAVLSTNGFTEQNNIKSELTALFDKLNGADNTQKSSIENEIVSFKDLAIDFLVDKLASSKGIQRGVAAMSLIRIGESAIRPLEQLAEANKNYTWVANYIIQEIEGTF